MDSREPIPWSRRVRRWAFIAIGVYCAGLVMLMILERALIYPAPRADVGDWQPDGFQYRDVEFESRDGTKLHGWLLEHPNPRGVLLFCHGNGEHVAYGGFTLAALRNQLQMTVFGFDYRGYGRSEGKPDEAGVLADGEAALQELASLTGVRKSEIVVFGRSLGGGVAVHLASQEPLRALILQSTFSRLTDTAAYHYPFMPVRLLMRNRYDSIDKITQFGNPILQVHGDADRVVPIELGKRLFDNANEPKNFVTIQGRGHNDISVLDYIADIQQFLEILESSSRDTPAESKTE